ncbi:ATPase [Alkalibacillus sp. S2W]|uniref:ATPase n=1 Tax=Alkalibacillus sp. S2W TaxID=3386553 RepID=UPI00398C951B
MNKSFWVPLVVSFGSIILLYLLGFIAEIESLMFKLSLSYTEISLLPILIGIILGFLSERMMKLKIKAD